MSEGAEKGGGRVIPGKARPRGRFPHYRRAGDFVFVSGVVAIDPESGERLNGTLTSEAHRAFRNLQLVLEAAGSSLERLVQVHAMIYDRIEYDALNRVYRRYVPQGPPARTVWSVRIIDAFKVQLDAVALA